MNVLMLRLVKPSLEKILQFKFAEPIDCNPIKLQKAILPKFISSSVQINFQDSFTVTLMNNSVGTRQ